MPVTIREADPYARWEQANVVRGVARGTVSAYAHCRLGDVTADQFDGLAALQRRLGAEVRVTNRQNVVFRGLDEHQLPELYAALDALGLGRPGAELARDVVSCPGADTCNLAVTQSRGLASDIDRALDEAGLAEVGGVRVNISGCTNSCGQHHVSDIGFFGVERRAHGRAAPGYQMLLGGHLGDTQVEFGRKALRLPAKNCAEATVRVVGRFAAERAAAETFTAWLERAGAVPAVAAGLADLAEFPPRRRPRLLRRLRRDRPLHRRGRRRRVRRLIKPASTSEGRTPASGYPSPTRTAGGSEPSCRSPTRGTGRTRRA